MRIVFVGAGELTVGTARLLVERGHEVVIIEREQSRIDELAEELDCSFLHGDGSRPNILKEAAPAQTDFLFCLTDNDRDNIIACLVGRSLGFDRVVPSILDAGYEPICRELGLESTISPSRTISRYLADMVTGVDILELSTMIKDEARFFTFAAAKDHEGTAADLELPESARVICYYRNGKFHLAEASSRLREGDEVLILTHSENLAELKKRFQPQGTESRGQKG